MSAPPSALRYTPLAPRTTPLMEGQAWRRWAGYLVASSYELLHEREYHAIRSSAALLDVSPLYKYLVTGRDAAALLDRVVVRDVAAAKVGQVLYTCWCDHTGKVIDDGTVSRLGERTFRLTAADDDRVVGGGAHARLRSGLKNGVAETCAAACLRRCSTVTSIATRVPGAAYAASTCARARYRLRSGDQQPLVA